MTRTALLLSSLFVAACTVGDLPRPAGGDDTTGTDAGTNPGTDAGPVGNGCINRAIAGDPHLHAGNLTHAGEDCMTTACHGKGGTGPQFQFAGTVYKTGGTLPNAGVNIQIKPDAGGAGITLVSDTAGNFNLDAGGLPGGLPAITIASACPTIQPMVSHIQLNGGGACNNCHIAGGAAGSRITLAGQ